VLSCYVASHQYMKLRRRSRLVAAVITLFSILFMQLAVASYACPALSVGHEQSTQAMGLEAMGDRSSCDEIDPDEPSLCYAHDQAGNQSLDKPGVPPLQPFLVTGHWLPLTQADAAPLAALADHLATSLKHATAPPLAIRNCCFRI
jgi:hypothetical protein